MNSSEDRIQGVVTQLAFGEFRLDLVRRRLLDAEGAAIELSPRHFDALAYFVEHPGELLDKDRLLGALWPGQVVEENSLNKLVSALRKALGDDGEGKRFLLTVPRRGFRFVAEVRPVAAAETPPVPAVEATAPPSEPTWRRRNWLAGGAAAAAAAIGAGLWRWRLRTDDRPAEALTTLAVLPFRPLADTARDEVLELGMADSLITRLSAARGVIVRPVGAVRRYLARDTEPLRAAQELGVSWVLEGTIQRQGERTRVSARLLDVSSGAAVWSGSFDETFTHVFDFQEAISRRAAEVLMPRLGERDRGALGGSGTRNAQAYRLYLEARYHSLLFTPDAYGRAIALYEQAIAADPRYAYAHAGLADAHRRTQFTSNTAPRETFEKVRAAAQRAVELDPQFGDGLANLGWVAYWYDWDWPGAERTMRRALELNPSSVDGHYGVAHVCLSTGRYAEALASFSRAREVDPQSLITNTLEGGMLAMSGRVEEGLTRIRHAMQINPGFWIAHLFLGNVLFNIGRIDAALAALRQAVELSDDSAWASGPYGYALAQAGQVEPAREVLRGMQTRSRSGYVSPATLALVHTGLGEFEAALTALNRAHEARDIRLAFLQIDHRWEPLRGDARFAALAAKLKLDPRQPKTLSAF
jgi:DNA-binding winged helix-turn-helix (wHTH) protein/TolB-like protein/Tfp pilus assembly protein PilF